MPVSGSKAPHPSSPDPVGTATLKIPAGEHAITTLLWYPSRAGGANAAPLRQPGGWPLIVFSQGFAIGPAAYSELLRSWASAGYVVAAPAYPFTSPDDTGGLDEADILNHPEELHAVVDTLLDDAAPSPQPSLLRGLLDGRVGLAGHSDGGDVTDAAAANSCCHIGGVDAVAVLSGAELASFGGSYIAPATPTLVVQGSLDTINPPACSQQIYDGAGRVRYYLDLIGAGHHEPYLDPSVAKAYHDPHGRDAARYFRIVEGATLAFWDRYLGAARRSRPSLQRIGTVPGLSSLVAGSPVAVTGVCPGSPTG